MNDNKGYSECCFIKNTKCPYEINNKCTAICGGDRPYGKELCEIKNLKLKEDFKNIEMDMKEFLFKFAKAIEKEGRDK